MSKTSNIVICKNRVVIEGEDVGQFESFTVTSRRQTLGATATLTLPLYGIGLDKPFTSQSSTTSRGRATRRVRSKTAFANIKVSAKVDVYCWYESPQFGEKLKVFDEVHVFSGFIEHIAEGFPTKFYLRDGSFVLRFGEAKGWDENATLSKILNDCINIAVSAFNEERKAKSLPPISGLTYKSNYKGLQAETSPLGFTNFAAGRAPFEVVQYLMQSLYMYGGVDNDFNLFFGYRGTDTTSPILKLDTRHNVISRDIVPIDSRFVDYDVKVTTTIDGKKYTATGGLKTSKTADQKSAFDKKTGEPVRVYAAGLKTQKEVQDFADRLLNSIKGDRNKGSLTLLLYPKVELLDSIRFDDTVFDIYDAQYYVTGYTFSANSQGYYQKLEIVDKVFAL